jgi:hypothetical protein
MVVHAHKDQVHLCVHAFLKLQVLDVNISTPASGSHATMAPPVIQMGLVILPATVQEDLLGRHAKKIGMSVNQTHVRMVLSVLMDMTPTLAYVLLATQVKTVNYMVENQIHVPCVGMVPHVESD